jgi:hypothetical protein
VRRRRATIGDELPSFPRSVRFTEQELELLVKLQRRLAGRSQHDILGMALIHLWVTLQRDERVHLVLDEGKEARET